MDTTSSIAWFKENLKFDWGVAPLPYGKRKSVQFAGTNLAVYSHLDEAGRKAAFRFLRFMTTDESTIYWSLNTGYLPVRESAIKSKEYQDMMEKDPRYKVGIESLRYAVVQPRIAAWEMIRGIVDDAMFEALSRRNSPEATLERAVRMSNYLISNVTGRKL